MKKITCILITLFSALLTFAQSSFKEGYIIDKNGIKTECQIRNKNWSNSPSRISYKIKNEVKSVLVTNLNAFGIYDEVSFFYTSVLLDESSNNPNKLSTHRELDYVEKNVLLKILVKGDKSLYKYKNNSIVKYFYQIRDEPITQLAYKKYAIKKGTSQLGNDYIKENKSYITQLKTHIACSDSNDSKVPTRSFSEKTLTKFFLENNNCSNETENNTALLSKQQKEYTDFFIIAGLNNSEIEGRVFGFSDTSVLDDVVFENQFHPFVGFGVQIKTSNKKLSFIGELAYNFPYQSDNQVEEIDATVDISYLLLIFGGRYHLTLGKNTSIYFGPNVSIYSILDGDVEPPLVNDNRTLEMLGFNILGEIGVQFGSFDIGYRQAVDKNIFVPGIEGQFRNSQIYLKLHIF